MSGILCDIPVFPCISVHGESGLCSSATLVTDDRCSILVKSSRGSWSHTLPFSIGRSIGDSDFGGSTVRSDFPYLPSQSLSRVYLISEGGTGWIPPFPVIWLSWMSEMSSMFLVRTRLWCEVTHDSVGFFPPEWVVCGVRCHSNIFIVSPGRRNPFFLSGLRIRSVAVRLFSLSFILVNS
jgi:hypothetical protein